ncbi:MAG: molecular chaperone HtpG, partial [Akkermansia sp.]|nr:molecular chaperone HtpG [Akkermansia sp.]
ALNARGFEVAFLTEGGDQFVMESLMKFEDKEIKAIDRANLDLPEMEDTAPDAPALDEEEASGLTAWITETFKDRFSKVSTSNRVTSAPAIALQGEHDVSPEVKAYLKAMGQEVPETHPEIAFNPRNPIVMKMAELRKSDAELAGMLADQVINTALLRAGMLDDPARLADNSQALLERLLNK